MLQENHDRHGFGVDGVVCSKGVLYLICDPSAGPRIVVALLRVFDCLEACTVQEKTVDAPGPWSEVSRIPLDPQVVASS